MRVLTRTFENERSHQYSQYDGLGGGVKTHENGHFLYKSNQGDALLRGRFVDYVLTGSALGFVTGFNYFLIMPFIYYSLTLPRKIAVMNYFTFHAELLPHAEQVVFHKAGFGGKVRRIHVDIKNLEKIDADLVPSN